MKKIKQLSLQMALILIMILCLTLTGCKEEKQEIVNDTKVSLLNNQEISARDTSTKESIESFMSQDFFVKVKDFNNKVLDYGINDNYDKEKNITISPISIYFCLAMANEIVDETSQKEILQALDMDYDDLAKSKELYNQLIIEYYDFETKELQSCLDLTNSIWLDSSTISPNSDVLKTLTERYNCYTYSAPFYFDNEKANKKFAEFVKEKTRGLIDKEFKFKENTLAVLLNTLYLKDIWTDQLIQEERVFTNAQGNEVNTKFLIGKEFNLAPVFEENYTFASTYTDNFKITFILPNIDTNVIDIYNKDVLNKVVNYNYEQEVKIDDKTTAKAMTSCIFPMFNAECDIDLKPLLNHFGVKTIFEEFKCKLTDENCFVEEAKHSAKLIVNEKGIEGAAITYMSVSIDSIEPELAIKYKLELNKPFAYVIESRNGVVLFSGICNTTN